jgi:hypothetical protein
LQKASFSPTALPQCPQYIDASPFADGGPPGAARSGA